MPLLDICSEPGITKTVSAVRVSQSPAVELTEAIIASPRGTFATVAGANDGLRRSVTLTVIVGTMRAPYMSVAPRNQLNQARQLRLNATTSSV